MFGGRKRRVAVERGFRAPATIIDLKDSPWREDERHPYVHVRLAVQVPGRSAYEATTPVSALDIQRFGLRPGLVGACFVHPSKPKHVVLDLGYPVLEREPLWSRVLEELLFWI